MRKEISQDYANKFNFVKTLQPYVLVTSGGRSGTDFLQSLLDGHHEVLTFNGHIKLYTEFFIESKCLKNKPIDLYDLAHEFYGLYIEKFKSRYDYIERKDKLGKNGDDTLNIDSETFINSFVCLLNNQKHTKKNILLAIYAAYHESLGNDYINLKVLFYHAHHFDEVYKFIEEFSTATIICTTRDPRAGFVSTIENWRKYDELDQSINNFDHDNYLFYFFHLKRITEDEGRLVYSDKNHIIVKLESLLNRQYMKDLSNLLKINFDESMMAPTFGGKIWYGDRISGAKIRKFEWSEKRTYNGWQEKLSWREKYIINYIMYSKLKRNDYQYKEITIFGYFLVFFSAFIPFKYELRYLNIRYISSVIQKNKLRGFYYLLFTPFYFVKVRLIIIRYATIQFLFRYGFKKFRYVP
jgi:hypothetical protein